MKISCLMITTNVPDRLHLLDNTLRSVEACNNGLLDGKTLSIDIMPEYKFDLDYFKQYERMGWTLVTGGCSGYRGMLNNMIRGLNNVNPCDYIYYVEDDVVITRLPSRDTFDSIATTPTHHNKMLGYSCLSTHILSLDEPPQPERQAFINNKANYQFWGEELFLVKEEVLMDKYYLNFPSAFIKDSLFRSMISYASKKFKGIGMEPGLTKAWFDLGLNKAYDVGIYVKPETLNQLPMDLNMFFHMANMRFWNNDEGLRHPSINNRSNTIF